MVLPEKHRTRTRKRAQSIGKEITTKAQTDVVTELVNSFEPWTKPLGLAIRKFCTWTRNLVRRMLKKPPLKMPVEEVEIEQDEEESSEPDVTYAYSSEEVWQAGTDKVIVPMFNYTGGFA